MPAYRGFDLLRDLGQRTLSAQMHMTSTINNSH